MNECVLPRRRDARCWSEDRAEYLARHVGTSSDGQAALAAIDRSALGQWARHQAQLIVRTLSATPGVRISTMRGQRTPLVILAASDLGRTLTIDATDDESWSMAWREDDRGRSTRVLVGSQDEAAHIRWVFGGPVPPTAVAP